MFAENTLIHLEDGSVKPIRDLEVGEAVKGGYRVTHIVEHRHQTPVDVAVLHTGLRISMWHPIIIGGFWVFPIHNAHSYIMESTETMFDLALDRGHVVTADGIVCCTLGHGLTDHVAKHDYFGSERIMEDLGSASDHLVLRDLVVLRNSATVYKWIF